MIRALLTAATALAIALAAIGSTGASFSSTQQNGGNSLVAKSDWIAPTVTMTDPGQYLRATASLAATAADGTGSGIASVTIQRSPAGAGTWTTVCTDASSPFACSLDTTAGATPDGLYDFRATAVDNAGNPSAAPSVVTNRRIDNTVPTAALTDPGAGPFSGTKAFTMTASDPGGGSGMASVAVQYRPSSGGFWLDGCTDNSSPYGCSIDTTLLADDVYDLRALATDNAGNTTGSTEFTNRRIDNAAPTVTMNDPGQYLRGTVSLTAAAADGGGISNVVIQRSPAGTGTWTTVCSTAVSPYTCSLNTQAGATPDGFYDFRAIATDNATRSTTSTTVTSRRIDNTVPSSVTITNPGASLSGTVNFSMTGVDGGSGIASVAVEYSPTGQNTWTTACSDTTSPYACSWDSSTASDGIYDFRSVATDRAGNVTNSAIASPNSRVDNFAPTVSVDDPGDPLHDTVTISATAADGGGISQVVIQYKTSAGSTWNPLCTDTSFPYSCTVSTIGAADGLYDFRAIATDNASRSTTSAVLANRRVDNAVPTSATMANPGSPLTGTVSFSGTAADAGSGIATLAFQYFNGSTWITMCTATVAPYSCSASTVDIPDGSYSMRSLATDYAGKTLASATIAARAIDNNGPTATMTDPGATLRGTVTLAATATDPGSGVASVTIQYKASAGSTWTDACSDNVAPFACTWDSGPFPAGDYDFRAVATDNVSLTDTSTAVTGRRIDNYVRTLASASCGTTSDVVTVPSGGVASGRTVLVRLAMRSGGTGAVSVTDSRGNTYTKDADVNEGTARVAVFSANVTTALLAGDTIRVSHPNANSVSAVAAELKNIVAGGRVDVVGTGTGNSTNPTASVTTTTAGDFIVGAIASGNNRSFTEPANWLLLSHFAAGCGGSPGNSDSHAASRFAAGAGPFTYGPTSSGSDNWAEALVAYKTQ